MGYIAITISLIGLLWGYFYSGVTPIWAGVILTVLHIILVLLFIFLAKLFHAPRYDLIGIPLCYVIGFIISKFKDNIVSFLVNMTR